jgi:hypothetical protein
MAFEAFTDSAGEEVSTFSRELPETEALGLGPGGAIGQSSRAEDNLKGSRD